MSYLAGDDGDLFTPDVTMGMEKFMVSARKYRPQNFSTVVGQSHITTTLKNAIKHNHLAHAFLFCGPRGVGKTTCARILAKTINCEKRTAEGEACNQCRSCVSFNEGTSLNIHELDAASNNSVEDIRTLVDQVRFAPQAGEYKVYIIDEVHMLSSSAFNAFLKTLEEPPPYAIFILATTEKHKILPTILSRCQIFDFKRISPQDIVDHLKEICDKEGIQAETAGLQVIAHKSEGCLRDALSILDKIVSFTNGQLDYSHTLEHLNILDADYFFQFLQYMQQQDLAAVLLLFDQINRKGFEGDILINGMAEFIRNLLVCKDQKAAALLEVVDRFRERYQQAAGEVSTAWMISALNVLNEAELNFRMARNKRLHVELALIKLTYLQQAVNTLSGESTTASKKISPGKKPVSFRKIRSYVPAQPQATSSPSLLPDPAPKPLISEEKILQVEEPVLKESSATRKPEPVVGTASAGATSPKLGKLALIREQFKTSSIIEEGPHQVTLTLENITHHWQEYTQLLRQAKNPAAVSFERARFRVVDDQTFEVICPNNLEQKFIEQERAELIEFLRKALSNKFLQYTLHIDEESSANDPQPRVLNTREQYQLLVESYPLVKELKDRLRLELDY